MKKLSVLAGILFMCACSQKEVKTPVQLLQEEALVQMDAAIKSVVADPNPIVEDIETKFAADSVVVLHCVIRAHNALGGYAKQETEYIYGISQNGALKECMMNLDDIMNTDVVFSNERGNMMKSLIGDTMPKFESKQDSVRYYKEKAMHSLELHGRPIKKQSNNQSL